MRAIDGPPTPLHRRLLGLRGACLQALSTLRMPSTRNEEYRFTDISPLLRTTLQPAPAGAAVSAELLRQCALPEAAGTRVVLLDGAFRADLSDLSALPAGCFVGSIAQAPAEVAAQLVGRARLPPAALRCVVTAAAPLACGAPRRPRPAPGAPGALTRPGARPRPCTWHPQGVQSNARGGPFAVINGAAATDALVVHVAAGERLAAPLHVLHVQSAGSADSPAASAARLLVVAGAGASLEVVEEAVSAAAGAGASFSCPVAEVVLGEGAALKHAYLERQAAGATVARGTLVAQAARSSYQLVEVRLGGSTTRHDVGIVQVGGAALGWPGWPAWMGWLAQLQHAPLAVCRAAPALPTPRRVPTLSPPPHPRPQQRAARCAQHPNHPASRTTHSFSSMQLGEETSTLLRHFLLVGDAQLADLHSKLVLDHPRGEASQLHKCIVSAPSGRGVFDGNVKVNRMAQKTDAGQLSRNLLLLPRATVNVKPNLQIIADDVKCTHGCTVSDLSEEELFYFRWAGGRGAGRRGGGVGEGEALIRG
jgi:hypothetical protein